MRRVRVVLVAVVVLALGLQVMRHRTVHYLKLGEFAWLVSLSLEVRTGVLSVDTCCDMNDATVLAPDEWRRLEKALRDNGHKVVVWEQPVQDR